MTFNLVTVGVGTLLLLLQVLAAIPWVLAAFVPPERPVVWRVWLRTQGGLVTVLGLVVGLPLAAALLFGTVRDPASLDILGRVYGALLQGQLTADGFVLFFPLLLKVWPKAGAIALASFRESVRQPMYWLLFGGAFTLMTISPIVPYFTFGEDHIMVKELGYDTIMLAALIFGTLAASLFVSEEIEGRTAITVMSKPVSRRQFLLGKFVGILTAALLLFALLGLYFEGVLLFKAWWERLDPVPTAAWVNRGVAGLHLARDPAEFLRGAGRWFDHTLDTLPGLVLGYFQVVVLVSIAVSLATRLPMVVNLSAILGVYLVAHLTPVLVSIGQKMQRESPGSAVAQILTFVAQLFDTLLPGLDFFKIGPSLISDAPPPAGPFWLYIASVGGYALLYTFIVLLFGLILFEDRDLA